jgi:hypothetical protein
MLILGKTVCVRSFINVYIPRETEIGHANITLVIQEVYIHNWHSIKVGHGGFFVPTFQYVHTK